MRLMRNGAAYYPLMMIVMLVLAIGCEVGTVATPPVNNGSGNNNSGDTTKPADSTADSTDPGPGGGDTAGILVELSVTPAGAQLLTGQSEQFYAFVTGTANTDVTWSVASGAGSINADGLYSAPATITADTERVVVKAVAKADPRVSATANVVVTKPAGNGGNNGGNNGNNGGGGDTLPPGTVCFEREVLPIIQSNCALSGCHDAQTARDGKNFTSYEGIIREVRAGRPRNSEIYEKITEDDNDDRMPPPPRNRLTTEQIATIRKWIEQGAQNTKCSSTGGSGGNGCDTVNVTYNATVRPILQNNCVGCHSGPNPPRGVNLSSYSGVKLVADNGKLYGAISHAPGFPAMPFGGNKLLDCNIRQIKAWIDRGAPNN